MADQTKIEWCDSTFNPWIGCTKISPACDNCYAAARSHQYKDVRWGNHPRKRTAKSTWAKPKTWQRQAAKFFKEHGRRRRVFCASLADVFDNQVPTEWRDDLWQLIRECPDIDWLILTKRPENIEKFKPEFWDEIKNRIWLGVTAEDQERANQRIPILIGFDCAVRFVSIEPALGNVSLTSIPLTFFNEISVGEKSISRSDLEGSLSIVASKLDALRGVISGRENFWERFRDIRPTKFKIDWMIWGGETGSNARPVRLSWEPRARFDCLLSEVPYFRKHWGEWGDLNEYYDPKILRKKTFGDWQNGIFIEGFHSIDPVGSSPMIRVGKCVVGHLLDGVAHREFPKVGGAA